MKTTIFNQSNKDYFKKNYKFIPYGNHKFILYFQLEKHKIFTN
jgi:hypothetical protein